MPKRWWCNEIKRRGAALLANRPNDERQLVVIIMTQQRENKQTMRGKGMDDLRRLVMQMSEEFKEHKKETNSRFDKHENRMDKQDDRMDQMNNTQIVHSQQIAGILETLRDIKGDTVWLRRTVTGGVIGGAITAVIGFIVFAIQNLN